MTARWCQGKSRGFSVPRSEQGKIPDYGQATGAKVDYVPGWPVIEQIDGEMSFGAGMRIVSDKANILGARLSGVVVEIPDFEAQDEILIVRGEASGPTGEFLRFIEQTPISEKIDDFTKGVTATGNGKLDLALDIPLQRPLETRLRGDYRIQNNQIRLFAGMPPMTQVNGKLALTEASISAPEISGRAFASHSRSASGVRTTGSLSGPAGRRM